MTQQIPTFAADPALLDIEQGPGKNYVGYWWCTDTSGRLLFVRNHLTYSPLCSPFERFLRENYAGLSSLHVPRVFVPAHFRDGVLLVAPQSQLLLRRPA